MIRECGQDLFDFEGSFAFRGEFWGYHVSSEVSSLEPDSVSYLEGGRLPSDPVLHKLASQFVGCLCFVSSSGELIESFLHCWEVSFVCDIWECLGLIAHDELEWGFSGGGVWSDVVYEFGHGYVIGP